MTSESPQGPEWRDEREIRIAADLERVWAAWAQPEHVRRWFSDDAHGEVRPGGELVHVFEGHGEHRYRVLAVEAPYRLVLEGRMMGGEAFRQEVTLRREGGTTILELVHSGFGAVDPDDETTRGIDSGWTMALAVLKHYAEHFFGKERACIALFEPAAFEYEALAQNHFFDSEGRSAWLETRYPLGGVLTQSTHEALLDWPAVGGALELKAYGGSPESRVVGVRATFWEPDADQVIETREDLEASLNRLLALVGPEPAAS